MVYHGSNPIKMDDLGGFPPIFGNTHFKCCLPSSFLLVYCLLRPSIRGVVGFLGEWELIPWWVTNF